MGWFSRFFFGSGRDHEEPTDAAAEPKKGKGTRDDGTTHYQDEVHNKKNGFRVQRGANGQKRISYPTADGGYVKKRKGR